MKIQKLPALDWPHVLKQISDIFKLVISACEFFAIFSQQLTIAISLFPLTENTFLSFWSVGGRQVSSDHEEPMLAFWVGESM